MPIVDGPTGRLTLVVGDYPPVDAPPPPGVELDSVIG